jgi:hypothetical protein
MIGFLFTNSTYECLPRCCDELIPQAHAYESLHDNSKIPFWRDKLSDSMGSLLRSSTTHGGILYEQFDETAHRISLDSTHALSKRSRLGDEIKICNFQEALDNATVAGGWMEFVKRREPSAERDEVIPDYLEQQFIVYDKNNIEICNMSSSNDPTYVDFKSVLMQYIEAIREIRGAAATISHDDWFPPP